MRGQTGLTLCLGDRKTKQATELGAALLRLARGRWWRVVKFEERCNMGSLLRLWTVVVWKLYRIQNVVLLQQAVEGDV